MSTCTVIACNGRVLARGLCSRHYQKWRTRGDPLIGASRAPNGAGYINGQGYHRRREGGVEKPEHVRIAEKALGKPLPAGAVVHHVDENRANNAPTNLVICPDAAYHNLIHQRMRALAACGNPNWRLCCRCSKYDAPENLGVSGAQAYHPACNRAHAAKYRSTAA
jgi:hypothetical protein